MDLIPESNSSEAPEIAAVITRAQRVHEQSAVRHAAAAHVWDGRGEPAWADFEQQCARIERELAELDGDRIRLEVLRTRCRERPDQVPRSEVERMQEDITRRAALIKADDAALERRRATLREEHRRAGGRQFPGGPERDRMADQREQIADRREQIADRRERIADERDRIADERERFANQREWIADERERSADERERSTDERERSTDEHQPRAADGSCEADQRARDGEQDVDRSRVGEDRFQDLLGRDQARLERERAAAERTVAERERGAERATRHTIDQAARLSSTLSRAAEALDASAVLAERHAERHRDAGRIETAAEERRVAERARKAANEARRHSNVWLNFSGRTP